MELKEQYDFKKEQKERGRLRGIRQKKIRKITILTLSALLVLGGIFLWLNYGVEKNQEINIPGQEKPKITVFYSPDCSCCLQYLPYLKRNGFNVSENKDMAQRIDILEEYKISHEMSSCHTSVVGDYFVEGHMPVEAINKLLGEKPEISGISLPGMPQGSPGMPGFKFGKWTIYSITNGQFSDFLSL